MAVVWAMTAKGAAWVLAFRVVIRKVAVVCAQAASGVARVLALRGGVGKGGRLFEF